MEDFPPELLGAIAENAIIGVAWEEVSLEDVINTYSAGIEIWIDGDSQSLFFSPN